MIARIDEMKLSSAGLLLLLAAAAMIVYSDIGSDTSTQANALAQVRNSPN